MFNYSLVEDKWNRKVDKLDKIIYNYLRQEIESVRFYSKCLEGTTYVATEDLDDIYDILKYKDNNSNIINSVYSTNYIGDDLSGNEISPGGFGDTGFYYRYLNEYGLTLKNLFTPSKLIKDSTNYLEVDLATTDSIDFSNIPNRIDGILLKEGHRVLVKNNINSITLDSSVDPDTYFNFNYTILSTVGNSITYNYYNSENGIYKYINGNLVRENDLDNYLDNLRYSVYVKLGTINKNMKFHLSRLKNGFYPLTSNNEPIEFTEKDTYIIRNNVEYRNVLDNQFQKGIYQLNEELVINGNTFQIPERFISVGDFGFIVNNQDEYVNIVKNKFKENLRDIKEVENRYLIVGENGTLLSMDKVNLDIDKIEINTFENLNSIAFSGNRGLIVGDNGECLISFNQDNWGKLDLNVKNNLNKVLFNKVNQSYIVGNNGVIKEINFAKNSANIDSVELYKKSDINYNERVYSDFFDVDKFNSSIKRFKFGNNDYIDINKTIGTSDFSIDFRFKTTSTDDQVLLSFITEKYPTTTGNTIDKGIRVKLSNSLLSMEVNDETNPSNLLTLQSNITIENNKWYHIFITRRKGEYKLYVNKNQLDSTTDGYQGSYDNFNNRIRLGAELTYFDGGTGSYTYSTSTFNTFKGVIDHVRLWDKQLDDNEINIYSNIYKEDITNLISWYKFTVYKEGSLKIRTQDIINLDSLILPSSSRLTTYNNSGGSSMIDTENYSGILISGEDTICLKIDEPDDYFDGDLSTQMFINTGLENIRKILFNSNDNYIYGVSENVFRIDIEDIEYDLFNEINIIQTDIDVLINENFRNISKNNDNLYLIGGSNNQIQSIPFNSICETTIHNPIGNCGVYVTVSTINTTNKLTIENNYRNDVTDSSNINSIEYIKTLGYPSSTQSIVEIPILNSSSSLLDVYEELYISLSVEDLVNGYFEISMDNLTYTSLTANGDYLLPVTVGSDSTLRIRAVLDNNAVGNKVKGKINNILFYEASCVSINEPSIYNGGANVRKLYFSQFDTESQLAKLNNSEYYSYLDIKSLKIDGVEKITASYSENLPKYLYGDKSQRVGDEQISTEGLVNCDIGDLCDYSSSLTNTTIDRIRYGFDIQVDSSGSNYEYLNNSYGLLEAFTINNNQIFGIDKESISNSINDVDNPYFIGIDFTKSFYFEVDSMILNSSDNLLNGQLGGYYEYISFGFSFGTGSTTPPFGFNFLNFNSPGIYSIIVTPDEVLNNNQLYYLEFDLVSDTNIEIDLGSGNVFSYGATTSRIRETFRMNQDLATFSITCFGGTVSRITNIILTDRLPTKNIIEWDPDTCNLSYRLNGIEQPSYGFLQSDGGGEYSPSCVLNNICDNEDYLTNLVSDDYWSKYKSKLLFLDYDIASKLYFFDLQTGEYQMPNTVNIADISKLEILSKTGENSWLDYSKDSTKEFQYQSTKNDSNVVKYSSVFNLTSASSSYTDILNGNSTNDISDINGVTNGLLPNFDSGSIPIGSPPVNKSYYFYGSYLVIKIPTDFSANIGDIIRIENSLIEENCIVIYTLSSGGNNYIYLKTNFNQSITNRLVNWSKVTTFTNLNLFRNQSELISNFSKHPIGIGYKIEDDEGGILTIDTNYNFKTAYYNLECQVKVTNNLGTITTYTMNYDNKVLSFGYDPMYNILDYLLNINNIFTSDYKIGSLPEYNFSNSNAGVLYTVSTGEISFNSNLKNEWESIPKYTFIDITFGETILNSVLIINKRYDSNSNRYIIETYDYYGHVYSQSDFNSSSWILRVRNTIGEISEDLQKLNNIQRSDKYSYQITDLSNNVYTKFTNKYSNLNFKPNTDSYAKALLSDGNIKKYLTGILYIDYKNELSLNMINLSEQIDLTITSIDKYEVDCEDCLYEDYILFENPSNNLSYNQIATIGNTVYYTNRVPYSNYNFHNQIQLINATGSTYSDYSIDFITESGSTKIIEIRPENLDNAVVKIIKDSIVISTISTVTGDKYKISFSDNGVNDLIIRVEYTEGDNRINISDIRVGNSYCLDNCYLTQLKVPEHNLEIGDSVIINLEEDIFELDNQYESNFMIGTVSGWEYDNGSTSSLSINEGKIGLTISSTSSIYLPNQFSVTSGETYRISFDYELTFISSTPSISPSFGTSSNDLSINFDTVYINGNEQHVESNFIPTSNDIYIGFNLTGEAYLTLNNIRIDKLTNKSQYYNGYQVVYRVIDNNNIVIKSDYVGNIEELTESYITINSCGLPVERTRTISNIGTLTQYKFDPYLNYSPIDLYELGVNDKIKQAIEIKPTNWIENSDETVSLVDVDMTNYRYRLIDGLSLEDLNNQYAWLLDAEVRDALIGKDNNGIVWYKGIWDCGRWFNGTWYSGYWRDGEWYKGNWYNSIIEDKDISAEVLVLNSNSKTSFWYNGNFRNGTWNNGEWKNGNFRNGTWNNGDWLNGTWFSGLWKNGNFKRGTWVDGTWENGDFSCELGLSSWLDGDFNGGNFLCGRWYNGKFESKNGLATFGSGATLSRKAIWENGKFINGIFNSNDNTRHDLSLWKTGFFNSGTFSGGTINQIIWNKGTFNDGVVNDIDVLAFVGQSNGTYFFTLDGDWKFNIGDEFYIINNNEYNSIYGSDTNIEKYKVDQDYITIGKYTKILVSKVPTGLETVIDLQGSYVEGYTNNDIPSDDSISGNKITSIVPYFSRCEWYNGQFNNGIFDGNFMRDVIWEKGVIKSGNFGY
jgi:hypothetical protein